jgi:hypothetical protein
VCLPATGESVSVIIPKYMVVMAIEDPRKEIWHGSVIKCPGILSPLYSEIRLSEAPSFMRASIATCFDFPAHRHTRIGWGST